VCYSRERCLDPDGPQFVPRVGAHWYLLDLKGTVYVPGPAFVGNYGMTLAAIWNTSAPINFSKFTSKFRYEPGAITACLKMADHYDNYKSLVLNALKRLEMTTNQRSCIQVYFKKVYCEDYE
ncbi:hypothetical protein FQN49_007452, partial [Arthroderma sp. PD_2]